MHLRMLGPVLFALLAAAPPVRAQPPSAVRTVQADSLGLAPDAEPLAARRLRGMRNCGVHPAVVVADTADLRRLRALGRCAEAPFPELPGRTLVGVSVMGDCHTWYRLSAFRSEQRREYRVRLQRRYGGCRAGGVADAWLELPPLPAGWTVALTDEPVEREAATDVLGPEWSYIRARDDEP